MNFQNDEYYMRVAIAHARRGLGLVAPNPSVGCVLVKGGNILSAARTHDGGRPHAEAAALDLAGEQAKGATAYVTLEPCAFHGRGGPCSEALVNSGVARVVIGCVDPNPKINGQGIEKLKAAGIEVVVGVLEGESRALNQGFILKITENRPMVCLKMAVSSDGKIASAPGHRTQITGALAGRYTQLLRSLYDSILVGSKTVLVDNPFLTCRLAGHPKSMLRVILDSNLKIQLDSNLVQGADHDPVLVFHLNGSVDKSVELSGMNCECLRQDPRDLKAVLAVLVERGVTRLLVEGGAEVWTSFLEAGLVDEVQLIRGPDALGTDGVSALQGYELADLESKFGLKRQKTRVLGQDLLEIYGRAD